MSHLLSSVVSDIQEFYEVTLLDNQRWVETSKAADPMAPVNLWDFSSLQSTTVTSDTLPSLSTSIEVRPVTGHEPVSTLSVSSHGSDVSLKTAVAQEVEVTSDGFSLWSSVFSLWSSVFGRSCRVSW